jgi:hypothetical protein
MQTKISKHSKEGIATMEEKRCPESSENPWNEFEWGKGTSEPQIKTVAPNNIIYYRGHKIRIDLKSKIECPDFAFALSITQHFTIGTYSFKATEADLNLYKKHVKISQQQIHTEYMHKLNPYEIKDVE